MSKTISEAEIKSQCEALKTLAHKVALKALKYTMDAMKGAE